ncbi:NADP(H)-dependent aldo-keto reductase [Limibacillus halophilus]|uniref:Protein tas n=1 Tax=Limibacillus halophilus TaxID=1579333 RepID=A0A839SX24_9PROT|nr:NADP(H)-dependent aldo-keto reductase [Limibacillus halophilus]MBB3066609.1 aryl-alcohol dehydrogenase-like predicted oxidoreductase [Limibacillus halophilus]
MEMRKLGRSGLEVSAVCLGTMTWGEQNSEAEGHAQMDLALERGINFFDVAEMYPVDPRAETYGRTEEIIGTWFAARKQRDKVILATKVVGPGPRFPYIRDGNQRLDRKNISAAVDASLKRLQTDYIDLYQLHWPDRATNAFGRLGFVHKPDETMTPLAETLEALDEQVKAGKIRHIGVSNETAWGLMRYLALSDQGLGPRMASIQNPYSLLNRSFEVGLAEVAIREDCGLLAYAPLAAGALSGKYLDGKLPAGARFTLFPGNTRYRGARADSAVRTYCEIAARHGLDPVHVAHAWVISRPFVTSSIIGATSVEQLEHDLKAATLKLSKELLAELEEAHKDHTYPCP